MMADHDEFKPAIGRGCILSLGFGVLCWWGIILLVMRILQGKG